MNRNVGTVDRVVRALLGVGALALAGTLGWSSTGAIVLLVLAGILLVTAALGFCPLYRLLGISTYRPLTTGSTKEADYAARH